MNQLQALTEYNNLKRDLDESIQDFSKRFNKAYNSIPSHIKPPPRSAQLHYAEALDYEFSISAREREYDSLSEM